MNLFNRTETSKCFDEDPLMLDIARKSLKLMDEAVETTASQLKKEVDAIEISVVKLRNHLIDRLRAAPDGQVYRLHPILDRVNTILSLIVSIEYPAGGIHREALEEARELMGNLLIEDPV